MPGATVRVLNGANLGRLGTREPEIYGSTTYAKLAALCVAAGHEMELEVIVDQTDDEGQLLRWLHEAADARTPVVLNPGGWSHTSVVLRDAVADVTSRGVHVLEVHISNVHAREQFRHRSLVSGVASGVLVGLGVQGYVLALSWLAGELDV
ncbi:type II 3-dehydroquinate dehydratase [Jatrophihabitans sp. YIM 134969]